MSITVRLFSESDLDQARQGTPWILTLLANKGTYSQDELCALGIGRESRPLRTYRCYWFEDGEDYCEPVEVRATGVDMLSRLVDADYTRSPDSVLEVVTQTLEVRLD